MKMKLIMILFAIFSVDSEAGPNFYCRKNPDLMPAYASITVKGCNTDADAPAGICVYPSVGCVRVDANVKHAAKYKFGKDFAVLSTAEKESLIQVLTPNLWVAQGATPSSDVRSEAEKKRKEGLVAGVSDPKLKSLLLNEIDPIDLLSSSLQCRAEKGFKAGEASCPTPEKCKDDVYFNVVSATIQAADFEKLSGEVNSPNGQPILPARVFNAGEAR
ncbi:MAG: hypothetical protein H7301_03335 [Cryobacterium sp.]|nr:hypothetical protein [Oligoflexia bacterium]